MGMLVGVVNTLMWQVHVSIAQKWATSEPIVTYSCVCDGMLLIKFLGGSVVARKLYLMQTLRLTLYLVGYF